jgi:AcrR family transcriptional regulator
MLTLEVTDRRVTQKTTTPTTTKTDGRRERTKRTRDAILTALTALLDEGRIEPTAGEIAERAGVALRSIGQHFASREELMLAVAQHHAARLPHTFVDPDASFDERLTAFVNDRSHVLEASRAMRRAASVVLGRSPAVAQALQRTAAERRTEAARLFAQEIKATKEPEATQRAVAVVSSGRAWDSLRNDMGLGVRAAKEQLAFMLRALLAPRRR